MRKEIVNPGLRGNDPGFKFYVVEKTLSYVDGQVLIIVSPKDAAEDSEIEFNSETPEIERLFFVTSVVKSIRNYFLNRAMDLQTARTTGACCQDIMLGASLAIPGIKEITEAKAQSRPFQSTMYLNCEPPDFVADSLAK